MQQTLIKYLPEGFSYVPDVLNSDEAQRYFELLNDEILWMHEKLKMFGKTITTKRTSALYGDKDAEYTYAGYTQQVHPWTKTLQALKEKIEAVSEHTFNICLLNRYNDGTQCMGWHADDEPELGNRPVIASLSLGAPRYFDIKHTETGEKTRILLESGSILIMSDDSQSLYKHQLPKMTQEVGSRINLTFRTVL